MAQQQLEDIRRRTIGHYDDNADAFREHTRDHDVSQNIDALLRHLPTAAPACILDIGCGPGRDVLTLRNLGHEVVGLDGSARFCAMARRLSGCEILHRDLLALDLPAEEYGERFDGIFANAVLFHIPCSELPRVLAELCGLLKPGGVLFSSNPRGHNEEGWQGNRYGVWHDWPQWQRFLGAAGFCELEHYYRPAGLPRAQQPWLASVWRKA